MTNWRRHQRGRGLGGVTAHLSRRTLIAIGNSVASVIKADPSRSKLSTLTVQAWVQIGTDAAGEDPNTPSISLDFQNYAKSKPARAPESAWH